MGKFKERVNKRVIKNGKIGIVYLNWFSRLVVGFGLLALVGVIFGVVSGINRLEEADTKYVELIESEDFEFNLLAIGYESVEHFKDDINIESSETTPNSVVADYVIRGIAMVIEMLALLALYMGAWVVTGSIIRDEEKPFKRENLRALKKTAIVLLTLTVIEFLFDGIFVLSSSFDSLLYLLIICLFVYLFDAGCNLQEKK